MNLDQAEEFYGQSYEQGEKVRVEHVENFFFRFTARYINIGSKYKLFELLPLKSGQPAEYCFLTIDKMRGVIISDPFHEHKARLMAIAPAPAKKLPPPVVASRPLPPPVPKAALQPKVEPHPDKGKGEEPGSALTKEERKAAAMDRWAI